MDLLFVVLVAHVTSVLFRQFLQILVTTGGKKKRTKRIHEVNDGEGEVDEEGV